MLSFFKHLADSLGLSTPKSLEDSAHEEKEMREHLTEREIDKTLADSFPASDPPSWH